MKRHPDGGDDFVGEGGWLGRGCVMSRGFRPPFSDPREDSGQGGDEEADDGERKKHDHHAGDRDTDALSIDDVLNAEFEIHQACSRASGEVDIREWSANVLRGVCGRKAGPC